MEPAQYHHLIHENLFKNQTAKDPFK